MNGDGRTLNDANTHGRSMFCTWVMSGPNSATTASLRATAVSVARTATGNTARTDFGEEPHEPEAERAQGGLEREARTWAGHELVADEDADVAGRPSARATGILCAIPCHLGPARHLGVVLAVALEEHEIEHPEVCALILFAADVEATGVSDVTDAAECGPATAQLESIADGGEGLSGGEEATVGCAGVELGAEDTGVEAGVVLDAERTVDAAVECEQNGQRSGGTEERGGAGVDSDLLDDLGWESVEWRCARGGLHCWGWEGQTLCLYTPAEICV
jgi:hypothetical protein